MPFSVATWNINSVRLRLPIVERLLCEYGPTFSACRKPNARTTCSPSPASMRLATAMSRSTARRAIMASPPSRAGRSRSSSAAASATLTTAAMSPCGSRPAAGILLHNFYVPAGGDEPDPEINPKFRHKLDFVAEMNAVRAEQASPLDPGRRSQHRPAGARCLVAQATAEDRQPHAGRDRGLRGDAQGRRLGRPDAATPAEQKLYTWWSYRAADWAARPRPPAGPHLVVAKSRARLAASRSCATRAAGTALRPCAGHRPVRSGLDQVTLRASKQST